MKKVIILLVILILGVGFQTKAKESMLSKEMIKSLANLAGISADDLASAISGEEEKTVEIKTTKTFTEGEWEKYEDSIDKERKEKYDSGVETGSNKTIKSLKEKIGLDYEGRKPEDFIKNFTEKVVTDAKLDPAPKIKELETDVEKLRQQLKGKETEVLSANQKYQGLKIRSNLEQHITNDLPIGMTKEDALMIIQNKMSFELDEDGKEIVKKNGEVLKTAKTRENIGFGEAINDFQTEKNWRKGKGGRDDGDDGGTGSTSDPKKIRKMSDMSKYFEDNDINPLSQDARAYINEASQNASEAKEEFEFDE